MKSTIFVNIYWSLKKFLRKLYLHIELLIVLKITNESMFVWVYICVCVCVKIWEIIQCTYLLIWGVVLYIYIYIYIYIYKIQRITHTKKHTYMEREKERIYIHTHFIHIYKKKHTLRKGEICALTHKKKHTYTHTERKNTHTHTHTYMCVWEKKMVICISVYVKKCLCMCMIYVCMCMKKSVCMCVWNKCEKFFYKYVCEWVKKMCVCIYIYIYIEGERDSGMGARKTHTGTQAYIYMIKKYNGWILKKKMWEIWLRGSGDGCSSMGNNSLVDFTSPSSEQFQYCNCWPDEKKKIYMKRIKKKLHEAFIWAECAGFDNELNYHEQKIRQALAHDIPKHWTAVSTLLGLISSDLPNWRSNQRSQKAEPKLYDWAINSHRIQVMPNKLVMVTAQPVNLNDGVLCKEYGCNLQNTFRLISHAITMTSWFSIICVQYELMVSSRVSALHSVVAGSISSGGDHSTVKTAVQCFRMSCECSPNFLVLVIQFII